MEERGSKSDVSDVSDVESSVSSEPEPERTKQGVGQPQRATWNGSLFGVLKLQKPRNRGEMEGLVGALTYTRVAQFLLSLISFASLAAHYKVNEVIGGNSMLNWMLCVGITAFLFSMGNGVLGFICMSGGPIEQGIVNMFVDSSLYGDVALAFVSLSAFTAGASFSSICVNTELTSCTEARLSAAFMFLLWLSLLYSLALSVFLKMARNLLDSDVLI